MRKEEVVLRKWGRHSGTHVTENQNKGYWIHVEGMGGDRGLGEKRR